MILNVSTMSPAEVMAEAARRQARRAKNPAAKLTQDCAEEGHSLPVWDAKEDRRLEKHVQESVVKLYRAHGCVVMRLSQPRATKQTPGLPDLRVFSERCGRHWDHETKKHDGKLSSAQEDYVRLAKLTGLDVVVGGVAAAEDQLIALGLATRDEYGLHPVPR